MGHTVVDLAEGVLLTVVRDRIRLALPELHPDNIQIEIDEMVPPITGERYIAVQPGGVRYGPLQFTSGGLRDFIYSVEVSVIMRAARVPWDRTRELYMGDTLDNLERYVRAIDEAIDVNHRAIMCEANSKLPVVEGRTISGFVEPLRTAYIEPRPRLVSSAMFASTGEPRAGLVRKIRFDGARRIETFV